MRAILITLVLVLAVAGVAAAPDPSNVFAKRDTYISEDVLKMLPLEEKKAVMPKKEDTWTVKDAGADRIIESATTHPDYKFREVRAGHPTITPIVKKPSAAAQHEDSPTTRHVDDNNDKRKFQFMEQNAIPDDERPKRFRLEPRFRAALQVHGAAELPPAVKRARAERAKARKAADGRLHPHHHTAPVAPRAVPPSMNPDAPDVFNDDTMLETNAKAAKHAQPSFIEDAEQMAAAKTFREEPIFVQTVHSKEPPAVAAPAFAAPPAGPAPVAAPKKQQQEDVLREVFG